MFCSTKESGMTISGQHRLVETIKIIVLKREMKLTSTQNLNVNISNSFVHNCQNLVTTSMSCPHKCINNICETLLTM